MANKPLSRVLIANRGEIAVRIIRSLREANIQSVAVYSEADANSLHRKLADFAIPLKGTTSAETYLNIPILLEAIRSSGADGVHPGYGFLSENADFAEQVTNLGVKFIGPSAHAMRLMGDKVKAKRLMIEHKVPVVPGSEGGLRNPDELKALCDRIGYPVILKASAGGGGRGMRVVNGEKDIRDAFEGCSREALSYFGNPEIFAERYIHDPRHIEIQVLCDGHGNGVYLFERDCSVQRRHQKLIEEAPSMFLTPELRHKIGEIAVTAARAAGYESAGTVEFIAESPERIYFMEMNTRIQVEHPVSEMITGIDLVGEQIRVANGEKLKFTQDQIQLHGWAIEARINVEDPKAGFVPAPGRITRLHLPSGPFVRVDTHIYEGYEVPATYDSMIAKLIVWGQTRDEAIERMKRALCEMEIGGVPTTARFHEAVLDHAEFRSGDFNTGFIEKNHDNLLATMTAGDAERDDLAALMATLLVQDQFAGQTLKIQSDTRARWQEAGRREVMRR